MEKNEIKKVIAYYITETCQVCPCRKDGYSGKHSFCSYKTIFKRTILIIFNIK